MAQDSIHPDEHHFEHQLAWSDFFVRPKGYNTIGVLFLPHLELLKMPSYLLTQQKPPTEKIT